MNRRNTTAGRTSNKQPTGPAVTRLSAPRTPSRHLQDSFEASAATGDGGRGTRPTQPTLRPPLAAHKRESIERSAVLAGRTSPHPRTPASDLAAVSVETVGMWRELLMGTGRTLAAAANERDRTHAVAAATVNANGPPAVGPEAAGWIRHVGKAYESILDLADDMQAAVDTASRTTAAADAPDALPSSPAALRAALLRERAESAANREALLSRLRSAGETEERMWREMAAEFTVIEGLVGRSEPQQNKAAPSNTQQGGRGTVTTAATATMVTTALAEDYAVPEQRLAATVAAHRHYAAAVADQHSEELLELITDACARERRLTSEAEASERSLVQLLALRGVTAISGNTAQVQPTRINNNPGRDTTPGAADDDDTPPPSARKGSIRGPRTHTTTSATTTTAAELSAQHREEMFLLLQRLRESEAEKEGLAAHAARLREELLGLHSIDLAIGESGWEIYNERGEREVLKRGPKPPSVRGEYNQPGAAYAAGVVGADASSSSAASFGSTRFEWGGAVDLGGSERVENRRVCRADRDEHHHHHHIGSDGDKSSGDSDGSDSGEAHRIMARREDRAVRAALLDLQLRNDQLETRNRVLQRELDELTAAPTPPSLVGTPCANDRRPGHTHHHHHHHHHQQQQQQPITTAAAATVSGMETRLSYNDPASAGSSPSLLLPPPRRGVSLDQVDALYNNIFTPDQLPPYPPTAARVCGGGVVPVGGAPGSGGHSPVDRVVNPAIWIASSCGEPVDLTARTAQLTQWAKRPYSDGDDSSYVINRAEMDTHSGSGSDSDDDDDNREERNGPNHCGTRGSASDRASNTSTLCGVDPTAVGAHGDFSDDQDERNSPLQWF